MCLLGSVLNGGVSDKNVLSSPLDKYTEGLPTVFKSLYLDALCIILLETFEKIRNSSLSFLLIITVTILDIN